MSTSSKFYNKSKKQTMKVSLKTDESSDVESSSSESKETVREVKDEPSCVDGYKYVINNEATEFGYFIGEPYYITIHYDDKNNIKIFETKRSIKDKELHKVQLPKAWVIKCCEVLNLRRRIRDVKNGVYKETQNVKIPIEICREFYNLGISNMDIGNYQDAIKHFNSCLQYRNNDLNIIYLISYCYLKLDMLNNSIKSLDYALKHGYKDILKIKEVINERLKECVFRFNEMK